MADDNGGSEALFWVTVVIIVVLLLTFPLVSEVIFQWVPATVSVLLGEPPQEVEGMPDVVLTTDVAPDVGDEEIDRGGFLGGVLNGELFQIWRIVVAVSVFVSLLLISGVVYSVIRIWQIRATERVRFQKGRQSVAEGNTTRSQLRWQRIKQEAESESPEKWRMAILEADIMLDELLDVQGYRGETMGEKMKQVERADFNSIEDAWDAHKVRNRIAHLGSAHELNQREVQRVIGLYENVFREFHFI